MPGRTLSHYQTIRKIGEGGMGEVYLAEDTSLKREVALKFLPESVRHDPERLRRFRTEAEAAAKLNHPNIATVHSIEEADGELFITMEYVNGKPLSAHIGEGGLDADRFLGWFLPLSDALAHAHERGLIHRDLKPANIMVGNDGTPKILDFGLARIETGEEAGEDSEAPTRNVVPHDDNAPPSLTAAGALLGTPAYMSPEQIEGKRVDARTDLFSMGVVMYEALTGKRPFQGSTVESIIARILEVEPEPLTAVEPLTPYSLWSTIRRCLKKDRELRLPTARILNEELRDVQHELQSGTTLVEAREVSSKPARSSRVAAAAALAAVFVGVMAGRLFGPESAEPPLRKWQIEMPVSKGLTFGDSPRISPDGTKIAYINQNQLWIRELDQVTPRAVPDSDGARYVFWSPESDTVGYFNELGLHTVAGEGGPSIRFSGATINRGSTGGGVFRADGSVVFSTGGRTEGILWVPADGGAPRTFLEPDESRNERDFHELSQLPDSDALLTVGHTLTAETEGFGQIVLIVNEERRTLLDYPGEFVQQPVYAPPGYIVFQRGSEIWGVRFTLSELAVDGTPFRIAHDARAPSVSEDGTLVYLRGSEELQLSWVDGDGRLSSPVGEPHVALFAPIVSPDGERVASAASLTVSDTSDVWIQDGSRGTRTRLTAGPELEVEPAWSPDGALIAFNQGGTIFTVATDGRGEEPLRRVSGGNPSWSHDGRYFVYQVRSRETSRDLWYVALEDPSATPTPLLQSSFNNGAPQFSPDSRYVAYVSDQSGRNEVYVTDFPGGNDRRAVSVSGGVHPRWSPRGDAIFYLEDRRLMMVSVRTSPAFEVDVLRALFTADEAGVSFESISPYGGPPYDVHRDGQELLVVKRVTDEDSRPGIVVVENWYREFADRK